MVGDVARGVGASQIREYWNAMLDGWNEAGVGDSRVLDGWNQLSFGWNAAGVGAVRVASDEVEVFVDWNEDIIVGHKDCESKVQGLKSKVEERGMEQRELPDEV